jgi:inorganic pyrophosphatase
LIAHFKARKLAKVHPETTMAFPKPFYRWRPHPWHGLAVGPNPPNAYIEITPFDTVKYEIEKSTGYLMVDRPARTSSLPPTLYGLVPQTYCGPRTAALMEGARSTSAWSASARSRARR